MKSQVITVISIHSVVTMDIKFSGNPANNCGYISLKSRKVKLLVAPEVKSGAHQSHSDSASVDFLFNISQLV